MRLDWEEAERIDGMMDNCVEERNLDQKVLCLRCVNGTVMQRKGILRVSVYCSMLRTYVPTDLVKCSSFTDIKKMDIHELERIAVLIDPRKAVNDGSYL